MKNPIFILAFFITALSFVSAQNSKSVEKSKFFDENYFVFVEGGTFKSFSSDKNPESYNLHDENSHDFYIARYAVEIYKKMTGKNPAASSQKNYPVENISGYDCVEFCNALSLIDGLEECYSFKNGKWICDFSKNGYRLPTLVEWEFAARAGKKSKGFKYSGSNNIEEAGWYDENSNCHAHSVGLLKPNGLCIYDMSGNVVERFWDTSYKGQNPAHVGRGGCWIFYEG